MSIQLHLHPAIRPLVLAGMLGMTGCMAHAHADVAATADVEAPHFAFVEPPLLVAVEPGVWVVHDYRAQIFFVNDAYWYVSGGVWYRAVSYDAEWVVVSTLVVPLRIRHVEDDRYVYFEGDAGAKLEHAPPKHAAAQHGGPPGHRDDPGLHLGHEKHDDHHEKHDDHHEKHDDHHDDASGHHGPAAPSSAHGQGKSGQGKSGQGKSGPGKSGPGKSGQGKGKGPHA